MSKTGDNGSVVREERSQLPSPNTAAHSVDVQSPGVGESAGILSDPEEYIASARYSAILECELRRTLIRNDMGHLIREVS